MLYRERLHTFVDSQRSNGGYTETAPFVGIADAGMGDDSGPIDWQSAIPLVQTLLHRFYEASDDCDNTFARYYESTFRFVDFLRVTAEQNAFIITSGLGDWSSLAPMDVSYTSSLALYDNFRLFSQIATTCGDTVNATAFASLATKTLHAILQKFYNASSGCFSGCSQADQAFALQFDELLSFGIANRQAVLGALLRQIAHDHTHFTTGIWGTKYLLNNLAENGYASLAYQMLTQPTYPSFGYMLSQNATTVWEVWIWSDSTYSHVRGGLAGREREVTEREKS
jgi:alpha-L-rhamnosidase